MVCPKCQHTEFDSHAPCPRCGFSGDAARLERLSQLNFLLDELGKWGDVPASERENLRRIYGLQRRKLEVELNLRQPPLDPKAAAESRLKLIQLTGFLQAIPQFVNDRVLAVNVAQALRDYLYAERQTLADQLLDAPPTPEPMAGIAALARLKFRLESLEKLHNDGKLLASDKTFTRIQAELNRAIGQYEDSLGLRHRPALSPSRPSPHPPPSTLHPPQPSHSAPRPSAPAPRPPRPPLTFDRIWRTLLSERTLNVMLFLGVALLFAAAVSLVVWNWQAFPPWLQLTFIALFTGIFYALGWYVRTRMKLRGSGLALTAVASLLVPLDFYVVYLYGDFPRAIWPDVWLLASGVCLVLYLLTALFVQAEFFGYLVALAGGSALAAAMQVGGISADVWHGVLGVLALAYAFAGEGLFSARGRWRLLAGPLWRSAMAGAAVLMLLMLGRGWQTDASDAFYLALAGDWWLGGIIFALGVARFRSRTIALAAAISFPAAALLTQRVIFSHWGIETAWNGVGLALLAPVYQWVGWKLIVPAVKQPSAGSDEKPPAPDAAQSKAADFRRACGRIILGMGILVMAVAAAWSLADASAVGVVHPLLAASVALIAALWRRPWLTLIASGLLLSGSAGLTSALGGALSQLGLTWSLLSVLHVIAAVRLGSGGRGAEGEGRRAKAARQAERSRSPLLLSGWIIAALALLPPLLMLDRPISTNALGNWILLNGWLAYLSAKESPRRTSGWLDARLFQWLSALSILPWVWLLWERWKPADSQLPLAYSATAWALLAFGLWAQRRAHAFGLPWKVAAHLAALLALAVSVVYYDPLWLAITFLLASAFYFAAAPLLHERWWLAAGGATFAVGWMEGLDWLKLPADFQSLALAAVVLAFVAAGSLLQRRRVHSREFFWPLYLAALAIGLAAFGWGLINILDTGGSDAALTWAAVGQLVLAVAAGWYAWLTGSEHYGHIAAWLGVFAGALLASAYSRGSGRSAALAALTAVVYVLAERGMYWVGRGSRGRHVGLPIRGWPLRGLPLRGWARRAWRLFRRPLIVAGWAVSVGAIGLCLLRNLVLLHGGPTRETWAIVGLTLVTALYAVSAVMYRKQKKIAPRFVWLAAALIFAPWTLLTHQGLYFWPRPAAPDYAISWMILALLEIGLGAGLSAVLGDPNRRWTRPLWAIPHLLTPFALLWGIASPQASSVSVMLGIVFYLIATALDYINRPSPDAAPRARFLYPAALLIPLWAVYLLARYVPDAPQTTYGWLVLGFTLPMLVAGVWLAEREKVFRIPFYAAAYLSMLVGTALLAHDRPALIGALLFDVLVALVSAWQFRESLWLYLVCAELPAALLLASLEIGIPVDRQGWVAIAIAGVYLLAARLLGRNLTGLSRSPIKPGDAQKTTTEAGLSIKKDLSGLDFISPLLVTAFALTAIGLPLSSRDRVGALVGYGAAAVIYALTSVWLRQPLLLAPAIGLAAVPYWVGVLELGVAQREYGLSVWPFIAIVLLLAYGIDYLSRPGGEPPPQPSPISTTEMGGSGGGQGFPWYSPERWLSALWDRINGWWALYFYAAAYLGAAASVALSLAYPDRQPIALALAAIVFSLALWRFRLRGWLLIAAGAWQLSVLAAIYWYFWANEMPLGWATTALAFLPVVWVTAICGLVLQRQLGEPSPLGLGGAALFKGWSRPLYLLAAVDVVLTQTGAFSSSGDSAWVTLSNALLLAALATAWASRPLGWLSAGLGLLSLIQGLAWVKADETIWPWALALLALGYGSAGYGLKAARQIQAKTWIPAWVEPLSGVWERPLRLGGWWLSFASLLPALLNGAIEIIKVVVLRSLPNEFLEMASIRSNIPQVQMTVAVFAILGLFYLLSAFADRRRWLGYGAVGLLLMAWSLEFLLVWGERDVQVYVLPAGLYLLGIGWLEWRFGSRTLARWVDYAALLLLLGPAFYQSLGDNGWRYALVMGAAGLFVIWWGSARRLRRFLYVGVLGVTLDIAGQLIEPLLSVNRWIVFGAAGLVLIVIAILVERSLNRVLALSDDLRKRLEEWE